MDGRLDWNTAVKPKESKVPSDDAAGGSLDRHLMRGAMLSTTSRVKEGRFAVRNSATGRHELEH